VTAVQEKFSVYDYRQAIQDLLALKQEGTVEDYTKDFEAVQFQVSMFNAGLDDLFFTSHFINGLQDDIKAVVQSQLPNYVNIASLLAQIQQQHLDKGKAKVTKWSIDKGSTPAPKPDTSTSAPTSTLWKERQLRDFRKANDLCYFCGAKFVPGHIQKCTKRTKPQVNALVVNYIGVELTDETLNQLAIEDALSEEMGQLPLNAIAGTETGDSMRIRALVQNKVMLILVDSCSSHTFISQPSVSKVGVHTTPVTPMQGKVANGEILRSC
jgi:hypothetical protein